MSDKDNLSPEQKQARHWQRRAADAHESAVFVMEGLPHAAEGWQVEQAYCHQRAVNWLELHAERERHRHGIG